MSEQLSCGKGLADNAVVPARLATLLTTMADVLEAHTRALDPTDDLARREQNAYRALVVEQRKAASQLDAVAGQMTSHRNLPAAPHDPQALRSPDATKAFERYLAAAEDLRGVLAKAARVSR